MFLKVVEEHQHKMQLLKLQVESLTLQQEERKNYTLSLQPMQCCNEG